jgi:hypothetical protein
MKVTLTPVDRDTREKQLIGDIDHEPTGATTSPAGGVVGDVDHEPAGVAGAGPVGGDVDTG